LLPWHVIQSLLILSQESDKLDQISDCLAKQTIAGYAVFKVVCLSGMTGAGKSRLAQGFVRSNNFFSSLGGWQDPGYISLHLCGFKDAHPNPIHVCAVASTHSLHA
jgi:hypothetical protein